MKIFRFLNCDLRHNDLMLHEYHEHSFWTRYLYLLYSDMFQNLEDIEMQKAFSNIG